jgi:anti-anti-sigma regulatory factor
VSRAAASAGKLLMLQLHSIEEFTRSGVPVTLMSCVGTLSRDDSSRLSDQLRVQMRHGPRHLLLDLTDVTSADGFMVLLLTEADRQARAATCTLTIINPDQHAVPGLDLGGLNRALAVYPNIVRALTALDVSDND